MCENGKSLIFLDFVNNRFHFVKTSQAEKTDIKDMIFLHELGKKVLNFGAIFGNGEGMMKKILVITRLKS